VTPERAFDQALAEVCGEAIRTRGALGGGDIATALKLELASGRLAFAKVLTGDLAGALGCEAAGLDWLREAKALRIPRVIGRRETERDQILVLEWIEAGAPAADHGERLGRGLAGLHRFGAPTFGLEGDNFIATLPQRNESVENWPGFYGRFRLAPLVERAAGAGQLGSELQRRFDRLIERMPELTGPPEAPARLHGDLWSGNALCDERGLPVLIDPAVYGGHREVDLAMMDLFGGFSKRVFDAYDEAFPLAPGWRERIALYQLYPLLVHLNLFGSGYLGRLVSALEAYE